MLPHPPLVLRPARDAEARACRMLLPEMFTPSQAPDLLVAVAETAPRLAGALALGWHPDPKDGALQVLLHVVPSWRRRGVGRALIEAAVARCRAPRLRALQPVPAESDAAAFLSASGFGEFDLILYFETDGAAFLADMQSIKQRLQRTGRVPGGASVVRLRDAPPQPVADLVSRHFPRSPAQIMARLDPSSPAAYDLHNSVALLLDGAVRGALIYNWNGGLPIIEIRVVDQALRGGWANVLLLEQATRHGIECGATRFQFFADTHVTDTMALARRAGAVLIKTERHFWRPV